MIYQFEGGICVRNDRACDSNSFASAVATSLTVSGAAKHACRAGTSLAGLLLPIHVNHVVAGISRLSGISATVQLYPDDEGSRCFETVEVVGAVSEVLGNVEAARRTGQHANLISRAGIAVAIRAQIPRQGFDNRRGWRR